LERRIVPSFKFGGNIAVGAKPLAVAVADVNRDGKADLVVANKDSNTVSVLLGNGNGTFQSAVNVSVGVNPVAVAVADLNRDGIPDLVVGNQGSNSISLMLGNGNGTFHSALNFAARNNPNSVAVGDLNGDGKLDLAVANLNTISVFLGNGDGTFQAQTIYGANSPHALTVADVNHDGKTDLVVANGHRISVMLGNGHGTFQAPVYSGNGIEPTSLAVGDFNRDGKLDVVTANPHGVSVLLGNGNGTFQNPVYYQAGAQPSAVAVADLNGDGTADLVVADRGSKSVRVPLGNGDGTFQSGGKFGVGSSPVAVAVADVNGNGPLDLVLANAGSNSVSVLLNDRAPAGTGTFPGRQDFGVGFNPFAVVVADVNGDGRPDLVTANGSSVSVLLGNGNGTIQSTANFAVGADPFSVAVADVNGDGRLDLVTANGNSKSVSVLLGNGNGTFQSAMNFGISGVGAYPRSVAVADVNGDGHPDIITADADSFFGTVSVLLGNGDGTFQSAVNFAVGAEPYSVAVADVNGDGHPDLVTANFGSANEGGSSVSLLLGNGNGTFRSAVNFGFVYRASSVVVADVNGDGRPDLVVASGDISGVSVLLGNGNGTFQNVVSVGAGGFSVAVADVNGDGRPDLVTANFGSNNVSVLLGNGNGTFQSAMNFGVDQPVAVVVADVNGDGIPDVVTVDSSSSSVGLLLGNRNSATHFQVSAPASVKPGNPFTITITALTAGNQPDALYTGTVQFTSSDLSAMLPAAYQFTLADGGTHTFTVTLNTTGSQIITATDQAHNTITGTASPTVNAGPVPSPAGGGSSGTATVLANTTDGVRIADLAAVLPSPRFRDTDANASLLPVAAMPARQPALAVAAARSRLLFDSVHIRHAGGTDRVAGLPPEEDPAPAGLRLADLEAFFAVSGV
jgi:hypothetical protein